MFPLVTSLLLADTSIPLDLIVKSYGVAAPAILGLCAAVYVLWKRLNVAQDELAKVRDIQIEKIIPTLTLNSDLVDRSAQALERAVVMMHQMAGRPGVDPEVWRRVMVALDRLDRGSK